MITRTGGSWIHEYTGLSTDQKPVADENGKPVPNGSTLLEMDTSKVYIFDAESAQWLELGGDDE